MHTVYARPLSVQAQYSRSCPIISSSCYNGSLVPWTVVSYAASMFILMILYNFFLLPAQFCYIIVYMRKVESCVRRKHAHCLAVDVLFGWNMCTESLLSNGHTADPYRKRLLQQLFCCCVRVLRALPSNGSAPLLVAYLLPACLQSPLPSDGYMRHSILFYNMFLFSMAIIR
jgi:hypothetical protein